jgi:hypothetical protein
LLSDYFRILTNGLVAVDVVEIGSEALETLNQADGTSVDGGSISSFDVGGWSGGNTESNERKDSEGELHFEKGIGFEI